MLTPLSLGYLVASALVVPPQIAALVPISQQDEWQEFVGGRRAREGTQHASTLNVIISAYAVYLGDRCLRVHVSQRTDEVDRRFDTSVGC